jgi:hypothetical protein
MVSLLSRCLLTKTMVAATMMQAMDDMAMAVVNPIQNAR